MASLQKVQDFDLKNLRKFKKSLICGNCQSPPRPEEDIYHLCGCDKNSIPHDGRSGYFRCQSCQFCELCEVFLEIDANLTAFVSSFKLYNCLYLKNGCEEELEAKSLEAHEKICLSRDMTCPKLDCNAKIAIDGIWEHYEHSHKDMKIFHNVSFFKQISKEDCLSFKGNLEELKKMAFVWKDYERSFFPQFYVNQKRLHFWIVGDGVQAEIDSFKFDVTFNRNGKKLLLSDFVKPIDIDKNLLTNGQDGLMVPVKNLTVYYDVQSKEFKDQEYIELQMKITSEKLDTVVKDAKLHQFCTMKNP